MPSPSVYQAKFVQEAFEALRVNQRPGTGGRLTPRIKEMRFPTLAEAAQAF